MSGLSYVVRFLSVEQEGPMGEGLRTSIERVLREHGPSSSHTIARRLGTSRRRVKLAIARSPNRFHIGGWEEYSPRRVRALYALGPGEDAPRPEVLHPALLVMREHGPISMAEIADRLGTERQSLAEQLAYWREKFHIVEWQECGSKARASFMRALYVYGPGEDAPYPRR